MKAPSTLILIVLAIALFFSFTNPQYKKVQEVKAEADQYTSILNNVSNIEAQRDKLLADYQQISKTDVDRLSKALPENIDSVHLALDLDHMASQYGIAIKSVIVNKVNPAAPEVVLPGANGPYETARVTLDFVSDYGSFLKVLADMERSLRILDVRELHFKTDEKGLYEHQIIVETYWHKS